MATSRDELFCKLAIRQGAWTQDEAVLFLQGYRAAGQAQRFGEWAAQQGAIDPGLAARIENAINKRNEGSVSDNRKRIPARGGQGSGATATGKVASKRLRRGGGGSGLDFNRRPVQSTIYVSCGVISIVLLFIVAYQFIKEDVPPPAPEITDSSKDSGKSGSSATAAANATEKAPVFSKEELKAMTNRIQISITDARGYLRDGKTPIGLRQLKKVREELGGDRLPEQLKGKIDSEITELHSIINDIYSEFLEDLTKARAASDTDEVQDLLSQIETNCGPDFRARAEKEGS